jgi:thymidylate synthase ThyX
LSNVGIYGSGQAFEALLLRMRAHPLPEARAYAGMMLEELRKVIPSFVVRVDRRERGDAWSAYLERTHAETAAAVARVFADDDAAPASEVVLTDFDPDGEDKVLAAICYPHTNLPEAQVLARVQRMSSAERVALLRAYVGERADRRHKPGRAFERTAYRFDVLGDYGAFRDLQRHRMLTIEWQALTPRHGYEVPDAIEQIGGDALDAWDGAMTRSAELYDTLLPAFPEQAAYAVSLAFRIRYSMQMNAREAMHLCELRSSPAGHATYRRIAQAMHRCIAERAGHRAIAAAMTFVDHGAYDIEPLASDGATGASGARRAVRG